MAATGLRAEDGLFCSGARKTIPLDQEK